MVSRSPSHRTQLSPIPYSRPNERLPVALRPSSEQVIKEINQVQVNTTNNSNAAASPRHTITVATQTDVLEEIDNTAGTSRTSSASPVISARDLPTNTPPLIVFDISEEQNCPENSSATRYPVPKPRSKSNLRAVARGTHFKSRINRKSAQQPQKKSHPQAGPSLLDSTNDWLVRQ